MNGYLSYNGLQRFWSKVKGYIDNKFNEASSTTPKQTYSTEEHVVGTWIDGRDIYEKTYSVPIRNYSGTPFTLVIENRPDIDQLINAYGFPDSYITQDYCPDDPSKGYVSARWVIPSHTISIGFDGGYSSNYSIRLMFSTNATVNATFYITCQYIKK